MAATKVSVTKYSNSSSGASSILGYEGGKYRTYVVAFTVNESATKLTVTVKGSYWSSTASRDCKIYCSVGTNSTEWLNYAGTAGTLVGTIKQGTAKDTNFTWTVTVSSLELKPGTTYYLSLYSYTKAYNCVYVESSGITLSSSTPIVYTITYNKGAYGSGTIAAGKQNYGAAFTLTSSKFTRTGYTQTGWSLNADDNTKEYDCGQSFPAGYAFGSSVTLYPTWTANTYTITYDGNGGLWNGDTTWSEQVTYGSSYTTRDNFFTYQYFEFTGWNEKADGSGTSWTSWIDTPWTWSGAAYAKDITLYAQWRRITYTITYNANGGTTTPATATKQAGIDMTLSGAITKANSTYTVTTTFDPNTGYVSPSSRNSVVTTTYTFAGWKATDGTIYPAGATYSANAATTLTAQWTSSDPQPANVSLPTPTKTGYSFDGWYSSVSGGTKYNSYTPLSNSTLFAHWTVKSYDLFIYDYFGDLVYGDSVEFNGSFTLPAFDNPTMYLHYDSIQICFMRDEEMINDTYGDILLEQNLVGYYNEVDGIQYNPEDIYTHTVDESAVFYISYSGDKLYNSFTSLGTDAWPVNDTKQLISWTSSDIGVPAVVSPGSNVLYPVGTVGAEDYFHTNTAYYEAVQIPKSGARYFIKTNSGQQLCVPFIKANGTYVRADSCWLKVNGHWLTLLEFIINQEYVNQ